MSREVKDKKQVSCKYRYLTELIGFEGQFKFACLHKKHPKVGEIYTLCKKQDCPKKEK